MITKIKQSNFVENNKNAEFAWLFIIFIMIISMIIIGAITRLTESGLSITKWELFKGVLPPLTQEKWQEYFAYYKSTTEYQEINYLMQLSDFKSIFWWEWIHRFLGRVIGLVYVIPCIFFVMKKKINFVKDYLFISLLGLSQGVMGWLMVRSGLYGRVDVEPLFLLLHLSLAFTLLSFVFFRMLSLSRLGIKYDNAYKFPVKIFYACFLLFIIQISLGAFVAGTKFGIIYDVIIFFKTNNYPIIENLNLFANTSMVEDSNQKTYFYHQLNAYLFFLFVCVFCWKLVAFANSSKNILLRNISISLLLLLILQIMLGITTGILSVPIILGVLHQLLAVFILLHFVFFIYVKFQFANNGKK